VLGDPVAPANSYRSFRLVFVLQSTGIGKRVKGSTPVVHWWNPSHIELISRVAC
jgi:hypothetical protein